MLGIEPERSWQARKSTTALFVVFFLLSAALLVAGLALHLLKAESTEEPTSAEEPTSQATSSQTDLETYAAFKQACCYCEVDKVKSMLSTSSNLKLLFNLNEPVIQLMHNGLDYYKAGKYPEAEKCKQTLELLRADPRVSGGYLEPIVEGFGIQYLMSHRDASLSLSDYSRLGNEYKAFWNSRLDFTEVAKACIKSKPELSGLMDHYENHLASMFLDHFEFFIPGSHSEIIAGSSVTQKIYINYFKEASKKDSLWPAGSAKRKEFDKIIQQLELSIDYIYEQPDKGDVDAWALPKLKQLMGQLKVGEEVAFCGRNADHAIVFSFQLTSADHGIFRLYNTGVGPLYTREERFPAYTEYHKVSLEWLRELLWKLRCSDNFDDTLNAYSPSSYSKKVLAKLLIRGQVAGSCSWASMMLYLKVKLGYPEYLKFKASTQIHALHKLYQFMNHNDPNSVEPAFIGEFYDQKMLTRIYPIFVYLRQTYFVERRLLGKAKRMEKLSGASKAAKKVRSIVRDHLRRWMSDKEFNSAKSWPELND